MNAVGGEGWTREPVMLTIDQLVETDNELEVDEDIRDEDKMLGKNVRIVAAIQLIASLPQRI